MSTTKDLDALVPEPRSVKLGGETYRLPGDMPLEIFLRSNAAAEGDDATEASYIDAMLDIAADLFAWDYPDEVKQGVRERVRTVLAGRGVRFILSLMQAIYRDQEEKAEAMAQEAAEEMAGPPQPEEAGTKSTADSQVETPTSDSSA